MTRGLRSMPGRHTCETDSRSRRPSARRNAASLNSPAQRCCRASSSAPYATIVEEHSIDGNADLCGRRPEGSGGSRPTFRARDEEQARGKRAFHGSNTPIARASAVARSSRRNTERASTDRSSYLVSRSSERQASCLVAPRRADSGTSAMEIPRDSSRRSPLSSSPRTAASRAAAQSTLPSDSRHRFAESNRSNVVQSSSIRLQARRARFLMTCSSEWAASYRQSA